MSLADFTNEEKDRINSLYAEKFDNVTKDDIDLISRWERAKAQEEAKYEEANAILREEMESRKAEFERMSEKALQKMDDIAAAAIERFERLG